MQFLRLKTILLAGLIILSLTFFSCGKKAEQDKSQLITTSTLGDSLAVEINPKELTVACSADSWSDRLPEHLFMEFSVPVIEDKTVGEKIDSNTLILTEPALKGNWQWESTRKLRFDFSEPPLYKTNYKLQLKKVKTSKGVIEAPTEKAWQQSLQTPEFRLLRAELYSYQYNGRGAEINLIYSGPVNLNSLKSLTTFSIGGKKVQSANFHLADKNNVLVNIADDNFYSGGLVDLEIKQGVKALGDKAADENPVLKSFTLAEPGNLSLKQAELRESEKGFYIDVVMNDPKEWPQEQDYYWENRVSLDAEGAREYIEISPSLPFTILPSRSGCRIFADFKRGDYKLKIKAGLYSLHGSVLDNQYETEFNVPKRRPQVQFLSKGRYLPREFIKYLPILHMNTSTLRVGIRQVYQQNLIFWFTGGDETPDTRMADVIAMRDFTVKNLEDTQMTSWLDLGALLPADKRGVFEITVQGESSYDVLRLNLTNLALVVKKWNVPEKNAESMSFHVLETISQKPVGGARVAVYSQSNHVMYEGNTSADGALLMTNVADTTLSQNKPIGVLVTKDDDLLAVRFNDIRIEKEDYEVSGLAYKQEIAYQAFIYSECGVYRPGEPANFGIIVRDAEYKAPAENLPVIAKLLDPRDKTVTIFQGKTNKAGMLSFHTEFNPYADTGQYELRVEIGGAAVNSYSFNVEEFVPERMKVNVSAKGDAFTQKEQVPIRVAANYLFGSPAAEAKVELSYSLEEGLFKPEKNADYYYGVWRQTPLKPLPLGTITEQLDQAGTLETNAPYLSTATNFQGQGLLVVNAAVFEGGSGRTSVSRTTVPIHPDNRYLGLKASQKVVSMNQDVAIDGILVDLKGNVLDKQETVALNVSSLESEWVWEYDQSAYQWQYHRYFRKSGLYSSALPLEKGHFQYQFTATGWAAGFIVEASLNSKVVTSLFIKSDTYDSDYYYGNNSSTNKTPHMIQPEYLAIQAPKDCELGSTAKVKIIPPYPGRMLFTIEADKLIEYRWLDVTNKPLEVSFTIKEFVPNVYISAYLARKTFDAQSLVFMPGSCYGVAAVPVVPRQFKHEPKLEVPTEIRPNNTLNVNVSLPPQDAPNYVTVAVVDEGILQLTKFLTPDPLKEFFKRRKLEVDTFDTLGWTLRLPQLKLKSPAGDEMAAQSRIMPVKPLVLWSGIKEVPKDGKLSIPFNIPQYSGKLRVMVEASGTKKTGWAEAFVTVKEPIVVQATFPRFMQADDRFIIPVNVTNLTGKQGSFTVALSATAGVKLLNGANQSINLKAGAAGVVKYELEVSADMGKTDFNLSVTGGGETSKDKATVPILPNVPVTTESKSIRAANGSNNLKELLAGWNPQYEKTTVWLTANKYAEQMTHLKYLIQYPYGCIEQTTSFTRPLLYIGDLLLSMEPGAFENAGIAEKYMHGANRLLSMQMEEGCFSYWPGAQEPTYWGTAYATHCLFLGMKQGYPIPQDRINAALAFMENHSQANQSGTDAKYGYSIEKSQPYMLYVLALAGKPKIGRITELIKNPSSEWGELREENLFLLKAALYLSGDRSYEKDLRAVDKTVEIRRYNDWSFWSSLRTKGLQLDVLEELFPGSADGEGLADNIARVFSNERSSYYFTTQELSWCVSALGKRVYKSLKTMTSGALLMNGKEIAPQTKGQGEGLRDTFWQIAGASGAQSLDLQTKITGDALVYIIVTIEGLKPHTSYTPGNSSLSVDRRLLDINGNQISPGGLALGDLVVVELTLDNLKDKEVLNVALVDRFACGLEIENPRLNRGIATDWYDEKSIWKSDYMDMKDDRIQWFGKLEPRDSVKVYYVLRVVTQGTFNNPPTRSEAMYDPAVWSLILNPQVSVGELRPGGMSEK